MKVHPRFRRRRNYAPAFAATLLAGLAAAPAAQFVWQNVTANWSDGTSWAGGVAPISAADSELIFGAGAAPYNSTHNQGADFQLNLLTLNSSAAATNTISATPGSTLSLAANGAALPIITQSGTGAFDLTVPLTLAANTTLSGSATAGLVSFNEPIGGGGSLNITSGKWRFADIASSWSGPTTISTGATVELRPEGAAPQSVDLTQGGTGILGTNGTVNLNGGLLKVSNVGTGTLILGTNRTFSFGDQGGVLDLTNTTGGNIASGDLALATTTGAAAPAVIRWNGGAIGLSNNSATDGNIVLGTNALRVRAITNSGPIRFELTNGAVLRAGSATGTTDNTVTNPTTVQGVLVSNGGDPTSGPSGTINSGISLITGRYFFDVQRVFFAGGITFQGAVQTGEVNRASAYRGAITVAGTASGAPGFVAFSGRGTGTALTSPTPSAPGQTAGLCPLWVGESSTDTLTVQGGGIAVLDIRTRTDQANHHGVILAGNAILEAGGNLRVAQSLSNFSVATNLNTTANVGDIFLRGSIEARGSTAAESSLDIYLPAPSVNGTTANGTPTPLSTAAPAAGARPFGGLTAESTNTLTINGTGFGGLRVNGLSRPNRLFSATGAAGGAPTPDPVSNDSKLTDYLTVARVSGITGSGGYFTPAAANVTFTLPNAEWAPSVTVGLKAVDSNPNGVDLQFDPATTTWSHNIAVDTGAELGIGANPFALLAGTLNGNGTLSGAGGLTIANGAFVSPGLGGVGALKVGDITLNGTLLLNAAGASSADLLNVTGNLNLGATSSLQAVSGGGFSGDYTIVTYTGALTGTFGSVAGLPAGYSLNYSTPGQIRLKFALAADRIWRGAPGAVWSTNASDANWQGSQSFADGLAVLFDDTATGSASVTISGLVQPSLTTFTNAAKTYTVTTAAGGGIAGSCGLIKGGTGTLILGGSHTYTGSTSINGGILRLSADAVLPDTTSLSVASGATFDLNGKTDTIGDLIVSGTVTSGNLTVGAITLSGGAVVQSNLTLNGGITSNGPGSSVLQGNLNLNGVERNFSVATGTSPELSVSGIVSNGALLKSGPGELVLGAVNTYTGATTVSGGILTAGVVGAIPNGALTVATGATVNLNGAPFTATSLAGGGTIAMGGAPLTLDLAASTTTFSGPISGTGTVVTKRNSGALTLSAPSSFTDGLVINGGLVNLADPAAAGSGPVTVNTGASLQFGSAIANNVTLAGGSIFGGNAANLTGGELTVSAASTVNLFNAFTNGSNEMVLLGTLRGNGNLNVVAAPGQAVADSGAGFRLRGTTTSDYSGTVTVNQHAKFEIQMGSAAAADPFGNGRLVLVGGTSTGGLNGAYSQINLRLNAAGQTYALLNNVEISGPGYVNFNMVGGTDAVGQLGDLKIGAGQILAANKNDTTNRTLSFNTVTLTGGNAEFRAYDSNFGVATATRGGANIQLGAIGESVAGSGVIFRSDFGYNSIINGVSSYTGPTEVAAGTLQVSASGSIASSAKIAIDFGAVLDVSPQFAGYDVAAAQRLTGDGSWNGRILLDGTLAPGTNGLGILTGNDFTLQGTAKMQFELGTFDNTSDLLTLFGAFDKGSAGPFTFDFLGTGAAGQIYSLVQFSSSTLTSADFVATNLAPGLFATFNLTSTDLELTVIPEPNAVLSLLAGSSLLALRRFRRRS